MKNLVVLTIALMLPAFYANAGVGDILGTKLSDAEIAHIVVTANDIDIEAGNLAKTKAAREDVKAYAHRMITDHTDVNRQAKDLVKKLNVTPQDNKISQSLKKDARKNMEKLQRLSSKEFDEEYIDGEIDLHKKVIEVADDKLVPNVKNEELKALLLQVRPSLLSHLEHAQKLDDVID